MKVKYMERVQLLKLPTPIHEIEVDDKNRYYIKRDDLTDFALGGNKARKIEFFLYDIQKNKSNYVVTYGSAQSNHCRIVAAAAARFGLKCLLILAGSEDEFSFAGNDILYFLTGATIKWCNVNEVSATIEQELENLRNQGYNPYFIPGGGHGNYGTHAYVEAYMEIRNQAKELGVNFDYIFLASGTGTTQAGLIAGKEIAKGKEKIVGISIAREFRRGIEVIRESLKSYFRKFSDECLFNDADIIFDDSYIGNGYADFNRNIVHTIGFMLSKNSIILDPVYTGKAFYGMSQYIRENKIQGKNILFIHTGGLPIFFAKGKDIINMQYFSK